MERIQTAANQLRRVAIVHLAAVWDRSLHIQCELTVSAGRPCICHRLITRHPVLQCRRETIRDVTLAAKIPLARTDRAFRGTGTGTGCSTWKCPAHAALTAGHRNPINQHQDIKHSLYCSNKNQTTNNKFTRLPSQHICIRNE